MTDVTIPLETLQKLFDIAMSGAAASSGYMDNEEVEALRSLAPILGISEIEATPSSFRAQYAHEFKPRKFGNQIVLDRAARGDADALNQIADYERQCDWGCYRGPQDKVHGGPGEPEKVYRGGDVVIPERVSSALRDSIITPNLYRMGLQAGKDPKFKKKR